VNESGVMMFQPSAIKPRIELADLDKIDVRVGTILTVEDVDGSDKLMKLTVSFGDRQRVILAGLKQERADPKELEGKQALFVVNLPPKKMRGLISEGMLFDIGYADGLTPVLAIPEKQILDGARAG
jgi:tRNA-binding protein